LRLLECHIGSRGLEDLARLGRVLAVELGDLVAGEAREREGITLDVEWRGGAH
jgi:hypothetical protein